MMRAPTVAEVNAKFEAGATVDQAFALVSETHTEIDRSRLNDQIANILAWYAIPEESLDEMLDDLTDHVADAIEAELNP